MIISYKVKFVDVQISILILNYTQIHIDFFVKGTYNHNIKQGRCGNYRMRPFIVWSDLHESKTCYRYFRKLILIQAVSLCIRSGCGDCSTRKRKLPCEIQSIALNLCKKLCFLHLQSPPAKPQTYGCNIPVQLPFSAPVIITLRIIFDKFSSLLHCTITFV